MARREKIPLNEKLITIEDYLSGARGSSQICNNLQINQSTLRLWIRKFQTSGKDVVSTKPINKLYSEAIKLNAVNDYLEDKGSLRQIYSMYEISSNSILRQWIKKHNGHERSKSRNTQGNRIMAKGRKTTYEESIENEEFSEIEKIEAQLKLIEAKNRSLNLKIAIDEYIEFYNFRRLQKNLKSLSPIQYQKQTLVA